MPLFRHLTKHVLVGPLVLGWLAVTCPPAVLRVCLDRSHAARIEEHIPSALLSVMTLWGLAALIASFWLGFTTAHHLVDENQMFLDAVKNAWRDLRLGLAFILPFIPLIGPWFVPDEDKTHYEDHDV